jgi:hypothetical protein
MKALLHPVLLYRYFLFHKQVGRRPLRTVISMAIKSVERFT